MSKKILRHCKKKELQFFLDFCFSTLRFLFLNKKHTYLKNLVKVPFHCTPHSFLLFLFVVFFLVSGFSGYGQTAGDFRSAATGNWTTLTSWQYFDGTTWKTPSGSYPEGYPGQYPGEGVVTIRTGHTITISSSITTQSMGQITIESGGTLYLNGDGIFSLNTPVIDVNSGGTIYFVGKTTLALPQNAEILVSIGGLTYDNCNNHKRISIGGVYFVVCSGAGNLNVFTFDEVMLSGGTIFAEITSNAPQCEGTEITLEGNYSGLAGTTTPGGSVEGVTYEWNIAGPGDYHTTTTSQNTSIPGSALPGAYIVSLKVSTYKYDLLFTNERIVEVVIHPLPTLGSASLSFPACESFPAVIDLAGLIPSTTFSVNYTINRGDTLTAAGVIADGFGNASFTTADMALANDGQLLQITRIAITSATPSCTGAYSEDVVLEINPAGTWLGLVSSDWNEPANWCGGVPTLTSDVIISPSAPYQPVIESGNGRCRNINIEAEASLAFTGQNTLDVYGNWTNNGTFDGGQGTVSFVGTSVQTIFCKAPFNHLTINNTAGVTAGCNITVKGILNLVSTNPSASRGAMHTGEYRVYMGEFATTIGEGDVTGYVTRKHAFLGNVEYTFGSRYSNITFLNISGTTKPDSVSLWIVIGSEPEWIPDTISSVMREYSWVQNGGTDRVVMRLRYLDSELNGNSESTLVFWHKSDDPNSSCFVPHEHGKTSYNETDNWLGFAPPPIDFIAGSTYGYHRATFSRSILSRNTWIGGDDVAWDNPANWSAAHYPGEIRVEGETQMEFFDDNVYIPDATNFSPLLNVNAVFKSIEIDKDATVTIGDDGNSHYYSMTVTGDPSVFGAWINQGIFIPGKGTVVFDSGVSDVPISIAGETDFYNLEVSANTFFQVSSGSIMSIEGNLAADPSAIIDFVVNENRVEFTGTESRTLINPKGSGIGEYGYHDLVISNTGGVITLPTTLNVAGDFINNGTVDALISLSTVILHSFGHNHIQRIGGSSNTTFKNLKLDNAAGVVLDNSQTVEDILDLTNGLLTTGDHFLTVGVVTPSCSEGNIFNASAFSYVEGKLAQVYCATGLKTFPIGKGGNYRPLTLEYTALTGSSTVTAEQLETAITGTIPDDTGYLEERYWSVTQTGGSGYVYNITLDGTPFTPGDGDVRILKGDGSVNTAIR